MQHAATSSIDTPQQYCAHLHHRMQASATSESSSSANGTTHAASAAPMQIGGVPITADHLRKLLSKSWVRAMLQLMAEIAHNVMADSQKQQPTLCSEVTRFEGRRAHNRDIFRAESTHEIGGKHTESSCSETSCGSGSKCSSSARCVQYSAICGILSRHR